MPRSLEIFLPLDEDERALPDLVARAGGIPRGEIASARVVRRSLDARKDHPIGWRLSVEVRLRAERAEQAVGDASVSGLPPPLCPASPKRVVIVGSGPAGTFAAVRLAAAGVAATVIERGKPVQPRRHDLKSLVARGELVEDSNYCFGEGGAGTFSDGKLYTRTKDRAAVAEVLRILTAHGAEPNIAVESRPHIGSNRLPEILLRMRAHLEAEGVTYVWDDPVEDILCLGSGGVGAGSGGGRVAGVRLRSGREVEADAVVLAVGHSARPIYALCVQRNIAVEARPFAVGVRVEHPQPLIDRLQYGRAAGHPKLPPAFYHVTATVPSDGSGDRGVYSFCMCPGGWVVPSATEAGGMCVNGMSLKRRDSPFANSAIVVTVEPKDFGGEGPLAGVEFQRRLEHAAFETGGGGYRAPAQRVVDFLAARDTTLAVPSSYRPGTTPARMDRLLPPLVADALRRALPRFDRMMPGFARDRAQLVGVETRTSAPLRILRDPRSLQSPSLRGLFPAGEGAGYAGGIVSAAIDGLRVADAILAT